MSVNFAYIPSTHEGLTVQVTAVAVLHFEDGGDHEIYHYPSYKDALREQRENITCDWVHVSIREGAPAVPECSWCNWHFNVSPR